MKVIVLPIDLINGWKYVYVALITSITTKTSLVGKKNG